MKEKSFWEILLDKAAISAQKEFLDKMPGAEDQPYGHLTQLLREFTTPPSTTANRANPYRNSAKVEKQTVPDSCPPHILSEGQRRHLEILHFYLISPLPANFSQRDLKTAYRKLARQYHPDMHSNSSSSIRTLMSFQFQQIQKAYEALVSVNEDKRLSK